MTTYINRFRIHLFIEVQGVVEAQSKEQIAEQIGQALAQVLHGMLPQNEAMASTMMTVHGHMDQLRPGEPSMPAPDGQPLN